MDGNSAQFANNLQELHGNSDAWRGTAPVPYRSIISEKNKRVVRYGFSRYRNVMDKKDDLLLLKNN